MTIGNILLLLSAVSISISAAEPSAFGAGDLNSPNPYGLTSKEKVILETKDRLHKVSVKSNNQDNKLDSLRDRIDGLQTIIESLSRKTHNNKINLNKQIELHSEDIQNSNDYEKRLSSIVEINSKLLQEQNITIIKQTLLIEELSKIIDTINISYVSKSEFNSLVNDVNEFKSLVAKQLTNKSQTSSKKSNKKSSAEIYNQAHKDFKNKRYTSAIKSYEYLIEKKYKPAFAHYMIGEMNFQRKNYANAISYFKKSSSLYSKASYMPKLMLHTAISMLHSNDDEHALLFFEAVIAKYPNSVESKEANSYIKK